ncbi:MULTISPECIES: hypothetical protein [Haloferax]|uniref:Uncharacterized protein n=1 Tax=Haloferax marinum TaxID=2666143 RepID=A0A6A8GBL1_9EURY|nr:MULTISPECIES: hypothetical protein [Haloferax]KAB1191165.1 hypothetical protein Hfx1150_15915 [Haloferax sp. CBA1150]MRW98052.1 hypothetical protein [Haloferax marinum]
MTPEKFHASKHEPRGFDEHTPSNQPTTETADNRLSLFVVAVDEHESHSGDCLDPLSDIAWLQFIDGLDMHVVVGGENDFFDTIGSEVDSQNGLWLVDAAGTIHRKWALPSERREVLSIGRAVEQTLDTWGDAR